MDDTSDELLDSIRVAIKEINEIWPLLDGNDDTQAIKRQILIERKRELMAHYDRIFSIWEGEAVPQQDEMIALLTQASESTKQVSKRINKGKDVSKELNNVLQSISRVMSLLVCIA